MKAPPLEDEPKAEFFSKDRLLATRWRELPQSGSCWELADALHILAQRALDDGDASEGRALEFMADLCKMGIDTDSGRGRFQPAFEFGGKRSMLPVDLSGEQLAALGDLSDERDLPPALRARVADIVWTTARPRRHIAARAAIQAYRVAPPDPETWFEGGRRDWTRAIQLALELSKAGAHEVAEIAGALTEALLTAPVQRPAFVASIAEVVATYSLPEKRRDEVLQRLNEVASACWDARDWRSVRQVLQQVQPFLKKNDEQAFASGISERARSWEEEGAFYQSCPGNGYILAAHAFEAAIQLLKQVPSRHRASVNVVGRQTALRSRLTEVREHALDAMVEFNGGPVDLTEQAHAAQDAVANKSATDALEAFVTFFGIVSARTWKEHGAKALNDSPLRTMFSTTEFSTDGRVYSKSPGIELGDTSSDAYHTAVKHEAIKSVSIYHGVIVSGGILPALWTLRNDHDLSEAEFVALAMASPSVPHDRARSIGRGLAAGYRGDFLVAVHLLAPQLEHLVRTAISTVGGHTRTLDSDGLESEKGLSALVRMPEMTRVFGETLAFDIEATFCDPAGANLRNHIAHGLLSDSEMPSAAMIYGWWLCLRIVLLPLIIGARARQAAESKSA